MSLFQGLLSICVPTYNRSDKLVKLANEFLVKALNTYPENVEVIVSDNSDTQEAKVNSSVLDRRIRYSSNEKNLGYAGNIKKCIELARGEYIWIVSDDDEIHWDGFSTFMEMVANEELPEVILLPINTLTDDGRLEIINTSVDWGVDNICLLSQLLSRGKVPFLYLASAIIRIGKLQSRLSQIPESSNDYFHALAYLSILSPQSQVQFVNTPVITYKGDGNVRFSVKNLQHSILELLSIANSRFQFNLHYRSIYPEHLTWLAYHKMGLLQIKDAGIDTIPMVLQLPRYYSFRALFLCIVLLLPKTILKWVHLAFRYIKRNRTKVSSQ